MSLFKNLVNGRLCSEQPDEGGDAPAASAPVQVVTTGDKTTTTEQKSQPEGDKPQASDKGTRAEDKPDEGGKDKQQTGAPEKYAFQAPDGVEMDGEALKDFEPVARELNLTNGQAQKLVDAWPKILAGVQQRQAEAWQKQTEEWAADVKADKEIGGDKLTANISAAQRAIDQFGTDELKEYLNGTGLGNHPELVKFCVKVGKSLSEDSMVTSGNGGQRSAAEVLYGK